MNKTEKPWYVYLVLCSKDNTIYTGATTNVDRRVKEHNKGSRGAKYTSKRRPVTLMKYFACKNKSFALKLEAQIKKFSHSKKLSITLDYLIQNGYRLE